MSERLVPLTPVAQILHRWVPSTGVRIYAKNADELLFLIVDEKTDVVVMEGPLSTCAAYLIGRLASIEPDPL